MLKPVVPPRSVSTTEGTKGAIMKGTSNTDVPTPPTERRTGRAQTRPRGGRQTMPPVSIQSERAEKTHQRKTESNRGSLDTQWLRAEALAQEEDRQRLEKHSVVKVPPSSGKVIGNFLVEETIGKGTFGKVKRGIQRLTGECVAIKILEKHKIKEIADVERVSREIKILRLVQQINVVRLYEVIDSPKAIYLIMDYVPGGELFEYIVSKGRIPEGESADLFAQICEGVSYLHLNNIAHRDLKPENLLLLRRGNTWNIQIADFGLSNLFSEGSLLSTACGSPCYAAPEMIAGKKYDGTKSDIWSLGVVLFAMICGHLPFEDDDTSMLYKKILKAYYKCPPYLSKDAINLLSKILNTDPVERYNFLRIRTHIWFRANLSKESDQNFKAGVIPPTTALEVAQLEFEEFQMRIPSDIMNKMSELNISVPNLYSCLKRKKHNQIVTTYVLLCEKHKRQRDARDSKHKEVSHKTPKSMKQSTNDSSKQTTNFAQGSGVANDVEGEEEPSKEEQDMTKETTAIATLSTPIAATSAKTSKGKTDTNQKVDAKTKNPVQVSKEIAPPLPSPRPVRPVYRGSITVTTRNTGDARSPAKQSKNPEKLIGERSSTTYETPDPLFIHRNSRQLSAKYQNGSTKGSGVPALEQALGKLSTESQSTAAKIGLRTSVDTSCELSSSRRVGEIEVQSKAIDSKTIAGNSEQGVNLATSKTCDVTPQIPPRTTDGNTPQVPPKPQGDNKPQVPPRPGQKLMFNGNPAPSTGRTIMEARPSFGLVNNYNTQTKVATPENKTQRSDANRVVGQTVVNGSKSNAKKESQVQQAEAAVA